MAKQNKGRKFFATTATAALVASAIVPVASAAELNDINQVPTWAKDAVQYLVDNGSVTGDQNGNFKPSANITRAEAATIIAKELGLEATGTENFSDVAPGNWFYDAVVATSPEIFNGDDNGKFNPTNNLTREQAAKVIVEAFGLKGSESISSFSDASKVAGWAKTYFETAVANEVIKGADGKLNPKANISKAEFATMIFRAVEAAVAPGVESNTNGNGGRDYLVTITGKDGKPAAKGEEFFVFLDEAGTSSGAYILDANKAAVYESNGTNSAKVVKLKVSNDKGEAKFTVYGKSATDYATPVVFLDRGTDNRNVLNSADLKAEANEITYFKAPVSTSVGIKFFDANDNEITSAKGAATVQLRVLDQNGKVKVNENSSASDYQARFEVENTSTKVLTVGSTDVTQDRVVKLVNVVNGIAELELSTDEALTANVYASYNGLTTTGSIAFTNVNAVADTYTGAIVAIDTANKEVTFSGKLPVSYDGASFKNESGNVIDEEAFVTAVKAGVTATYIKNADGKVSFELITTETGSTPDLSEAVTDSVTFADLNLTEINTVSTSNAAVATAKVTATGLELTAKGAGTATITATDLGADGADDEVATITVTVTKDATTGALSISKVVTAFDGTAPAEVTNLTFNDLDTDQGEVSGEITFTESASTDVVSTVVKYGDIIVNKDTAGKYTIAQNTPYTDQKITVTVTDAAGNSSTTTIDVTDATS
ncbi:S-layer homology domain-containing protein [Ureibacillus acetophenoni]|uniref:S-layer family protein n=1 Tax=Ureibacillus acetophenoni TaxID=614649 RepID=A0A285TYW8_9BACL|nr:S-layer homology domain-containing protein [Ureibacillus acetophenoni]SOC34779.1 S-layer family protein [Ureibacillus acetophenoni]